MSGQLDRQQFMQQTAHLTVPQRTELVATLAALPEAMRISEEHGMTLPRTLGLLRPGLSGAPITTGSIVASSGGPLIAGGGMGTPQVNRLAGQLERLAGATVSQTLRSELQDFGMAAPARVQQLGVVYRTMAQTFPGSGPGSSHREMGLAIGAQMGLAGPQNEHFADFFASRGFDLVNGRLPQVMPSAPTGLVRAPLTTPSSEVPAQAALPAIPALQSNIPSTPGATSGLRLVQPTAPMPVPSVPGTPGTGIPAAKMVSDIIRSEEHTSELQSQR